MEGQALSGKSTPSRAISSAADATARRRAQTAFDAPLLLEAGAGTGKTAVLVARIVAWCLGPGWEEAAGGAARPLRPREHASRVLRGLVAITFTDAATAEMAERVADAFEQVRRGELPVGVLAEALPPEGVREPRAAAFRLALDQLRIHTIHAFCLRLLLAHPIEAGVHPRLAVDADGQALAAAVREVIEEQLPAAFGASPDERWLALADRGIGPRELESALAVLLGEGATPEDLAERGHAERRSAAFLALLREALEGFTSLEGGRLERLTGSPRLAASARALREAGAGLGVATELETLRAVLADLPGWEGVAPALADLANGKLGKRGGEAIGADADAFAERAAALRPLLDHLERIDVAGFAAARGVLHELIGLVDGRLRRRGVASFGALLRGARDLLRNPEVRRSVQAELRQLLVDEFQDTDALQCEILSALTRADPGEPHPVLFLVGDPKQSIYGWRSADLRAYQQLRDPLEAAGGVASLVVNFRSAPAILAEVERLVAPVMEPAPGLQPAFEPLVASEQTREQPGFTAGGRGPVEHWLPARIDVATAELDDGGVRELLAEREARAVASDIADLRARGVSLDEVAILLRVTAGFEPVLEALREAGIPYLVERETDFYQRREIVDAVALVRCVLDPHDHLALVATLRSSAVGLPDAALLPLWKQGFATRVGEIDGSDDARLAAAQAAARAAAEDLPADVPEAREISGWSDALDDLLRGLHELRGAYDAATPERFVERLRERVLLEASEASRHLGEHRIANLDRFFRDLVLALDEASGSAASLVAFLRRAGSVAREHNEGRPRVAGGAAVHVLTIHRAKGLDWEHVYLLGTDRGHRGDEPKRTAVVRRGADLGFVLFGWPEPGLPVLAAERADVEAAERVRLLYVATTRAKRRLVVGARRSAGKRWRQARNFAELMGARRGLAPDWVRAARGGANGVVDGEGVRWRVVDPPDDGGRRALPTPSLPPGAAELERDHERLCAHRAEAAARAARPFSSTASAEAHARERRADRAGGADEEAARPEPASIDAVERRVALAAGTALHAVLETGEISDADVALERAVASAASAGERAEVLARARAIWRRFTAGPLAARLAALGPHVVARELPVFVAPAGDGAEDPVGFVAGAIDLLYRDPETGELVVADYKTDAVEGAELEARAQGYLAQGAIYTRAIARALGLAAPPRFELWFLSAGAVVPVEPARHDVLDSSPRFARD